MKKEAGDFDFIFTIAKVVAVAKIKKDNRAGALNNSVTGT